MVTTQFTTTLPADRETNLIELYRLDGLISELESQRLTVKADIRNGVLSETGDDGKPKYTNDKSRDAAVLFAEMNDELILGLYIEIRKIQDDRVKLTAKMEAQSMEFKLLLLDRQLEIASVGVVSE